MRRVLVATFALVLGLVSFVGTANAAPCTRLIIPDAGVNACVVSGGQAAIDAGKVVRYRAADVPDDVTLIAAHAHVAGGPFLGVLDLQRGDLVKIRHRDGSVSNLHVRAFMVSRPHASFRALRNADPRFWSGIVLETGFGEGHVLLVSVR